MLGTETRPEEERLEEAHPAWQVWYVVESSTWWATRREALKLAEQNAGAVQYVKAASAETLDAALREQDAIGARPES